MSTCNQLDLQTLGSQPMVMPKNLPDHWLSLLIVVQPLASSFYPDFIFYFFYFFLRKSSLKPPHDQVVRPERLTKSTRSEWIEVRARSKHNGIIRCQLRREQRLCMWFRIMQLNLLFNPTLDLGERDKEEERERLGIIAFERTFASIRHTNSTS